MKQTSFLWQAAGFAIVTLGGTLLHFLYDWTGGNILTAPFSGINESTWEHMKLLFWPLFLVAVIQRVFFKMPDHFWCIKLAGIALGLVLIPVLFYTYNGTLGKSPDWVNITIFYISAAAIFLFCRPATPHSFSLPAAIRCSPPPKMFRGNPHRLQLQLIFPRIQKSPVKYFRQ